MGTQYEGRDEVVRALNTYIKLMRSTAVLGNALQRSLNKHGLTASQLGVLEALLHLGPMCQRDVGRKLLLSGGNVTTVVTNLETRGLVLRVRSASDRRFVTLELTTEGRALIAGVFPAHAERITELFQGLTPTEQEQLSALTLKLGRSMGQDEDDR